MSKVGFNPQTMELGILLGPLAPSLAEQLEGTGVSEKTVAKFEKQNDAINTVLLHNLCTFKQADSMRGKLQRDILQAARKSVNELVEAGKLPPR